MLFFSSLEYVVSSKSILLGAKDDGRETISKNLCHQNLIELLSKALIWYFALQQTASRFPFEQENMMGHFKILLELVNNPRESKLFLLKKAADFGTFFFC